MVLTKFLLLAFVVTLVYFRIRRVVRSIQATLKRSREAMEGRRPPTVIPSIDLVSCGTCGDSVPRSRVDIVDGEPECNRCLTSRGSSSAGS